MITPVEGLLFVALAFLPCSWLSLYISASLVCVGQNLSGAFLQCPERLGRLVIHPALPFAVREALSSWGVPSWL